MTEFGKLQVYVPQPTASDPAVSDSVQRTDQERQQLLNKFRDRMQQREQNGAGVTINMPVPPATQTAPLPQVQTDRRGNWSVAVEQEIQETKAWVQKNPLKSLLIGIGIGVGLSALTRPQTVIVQAERRSSPGGGSSVSGLAGPPKRPRKRPAAKSTGKGTRKQTRKR